MPVAAFKAAPLDVVGRLSQHKCAVDEFAFDEALTAHVDGGVFECRSFVLRE